MAPTEHELEQQTKQQEGEEDLEYQTKHSKSVVAGVVGGGDYDICRGLNRLHQPLLVSGIPDAETKGSDGAKQQNYRQHPSKYTHVSNSFS
jgi:hypothetical protein